MFRVTKLSNKFYAKKIDDLSNKEDIDDIETFISEGTFVILCDDLEGLEVADIVDEEDVVLVKG